MKVIFSKPKQFDFLYGWQTVKSHSSQPCVCVCLCSYVWAFPKSICPHFSLLKHNGNNPQSMAFTIPYSGLWGAVGTFMELGTGQLKNTFYYSDLLQIVACAIWKHWRSYSVGQLWNPCQKNWKIFSGFQSLITVSLWMFPLCQSNWCTNLEACKKAFLYYVFKKLVYNEKYWVTEWMLHEQIAVVQCTEAWWPLPVKHQENIIPILTQL